MTLITLTCRIIVLISKIYTFRPPPVKVHVNDTLVIHVHNNLKEPTVIHAHGLFQNQGTNSADGAGMVTQW